jgi:hypothetical protein
MVRNLQGIWLLDEGGAADEVLVALFSIECVLKIRWLSFPVAKGL